MRMQNVAIQHENEVREDRVKQFTDQDLPRFFAYVDNPKLPTHQSWNGYRFSDPTIIAPARQRGAGYAAQYFNMLNREGVNANRRAPVVQRSASSTQTPNERRVAATDNILPNAPVPVQASSLLGSRPPRRLTADAYNPWENVPPTRYGLPYSGPTPVERYEYVNMADIEPLSGLVARRVRLNPRASPQRSSLNNTARTSV